MGFMATLIRIIVAGVALLSAIAPSPACAAYGERVALVFANDTYARLDALPNAARDAETVGAALRAARFDNVEIVRNASRREMGEALRRFSERTEGAAVALVYFAGHGAADESNFLVPVDAKLQIPSDLRSQTIPLSWVLTATVGARLRVIALDACRNNPFGGAGGRSAGGRDSGLVSMEPDDVLLLYAAAAGQVAQDGPPDGNSPFARAFSANLQPGVEARRFAALVREAVIRQTGGAQRPYVSQNLGSENLYVVSPRRDLERFGPQIASALQRARSAADHADEAAKLAEREADKMQSILDAGEVSAMQLESGVYRGPVSDSQPSGLGFFEYRDPGRAGQNYRGHFRNGLFHGSGLLRGRFAAVVSVYEAEAVARRGFHQFRYAGEFRSGERSGYGVLQKAQPGADFDIYSGTFSGDQATGVGVIEYASGGRYTGEVRNGVPHGWGVLYGSRETFEVGRWDNGRLANNLQR